MNRWGPHMKMLPLVEGECHPIVGEDGKPYYPEPSNEPDPEIREEKNYSVLDKDELWDYVTVCKRCGTRFIAGIDDDDDNYQTVRNFCPGCGKKLT